MAQVPHRQRCTEGPPPLQSLALAGESQCWQERCPNASASEAMGRNPTATGTPPGRQGDSGKAGGQ